MGHTFIVRTGHDLGKAVREARLSAGLTQEQLAVDAGLDRTYLARMESGLSVLLLDRAIRLLRLLGAEISIKMPDRPHAP
jgi:transcriptional regulator with XRE-family HTH domain